jgi:catechol 2,3-dioxygenase-like lactoylglutathione lyase family enzyme
MEAFAGRRLTYDPAANYYYPRRIRIHARLRKTMKLVLTTLLMAGIELSGQVLPLNSSGVAMGHLHIVTPDPAAHKKLWVDVLGGTLIKVGPIEFAAFPGVLVGFRPGSTNGGTVGSIVDHLGFLVKDLDKTKEKLTAAAKIVSVNEPARQFFALFPGDVTVEFTEDKTSDVPIKHHHIHFATPKEDDMRAWYAKLFGAVPGMRGRFKAADLPGVNLSWKPVDQAPLPTKGRVMDHIGLEVRDIREFVKKAVEAGAKVEMPVTERPELGLTIAFIVDPWGTQIELTEGLLKLKF